MRITDYSRITELDDKNVFLVDGINGTKVIETVDLAKQLNERIQIWDAIDDYVPVEVRRNLFRGKNLGPVVTDEQWEEIAENTFKGMYVGDYWVIGNRTWRIADINYWLGIGDVPCNDPHLLIMCDGALYNEQMNSTNTTAGGYVGSKMHTEGLDVAKGLINGVFGESHILNHRELLTNSVKDGYAGSGAWTYSTVVLPNEIMMYGCHIHAAMGDGQTIPYLYTVDKTQLSLTQLCQRYISPRSESLWLRDITTDSRFAFINGGGYSGSSDANLSRGVRPIFGIKG